MERLRAVVKFQPWILAALLLCQVGLVAGGNSINLPVYARSIDDGGGFDITREIAKVRGRYGVKAGTHPAKRAVENIPVVNQVRYRSFIFSGTYEIKTEPRLELLCPSYLWHSVRRPANSSRFSKLTASPSPQTFNLLLDTGSEALWVADVSCRGCDEVAVFNSSASSTFRRGSSESKLLQYGSGDAEGRVVTDTVSLGSFTVSQQEFGILSH